MSSRWRTNHLLFLWDGNILQWANSYGIQHWLRELLFYCGNELFRLGRIQVCESHLLWHGLHQPGSEASCFLRGFQEKAFGQGCSASFYLSLGTWSYQVVGEGIHQQVWFLEGKLRNSPRPLKNKVIIALSSDCWSCSSIPGFMPWLGGIFHELKGDLQEKVSVF